MVKTDFILKKYNIVNKFRMSANIVEIPNTNGLGYVLLDPEQESNCDPCFQHDEIPNIYRSKRNLNHNGRWIYFRLLPNSKWIYEPIWKVDKEENDPQTSTTSHILEEDISSNYTLPESQTNVVGLNNSFANLDEEGFWGFINDGEGNHVPIWITNNQREDYDRLCELRTIWDNFENQNSNTFTNEDYQTLMGKRLSTHTELNYYMSKFSV